MINIGFGLPRLSEEARKSLARTGFTKRQIDDVEIILGNKGFKILEEPCWGEEAGLHILAEVKRNGFCVVKVEQSMIVAQSGDKLATLGQKFIDDRLIADQCEVNQVKMGSPGARAILDAKIGKLPNPIIPDLNNLGLDPVSRRAMILDANFLANYFKSIAKIKEWGRLSSFRRNKELISAEPGLENNYYGDTLAHLVKAAIQIVELRHKQALEQKVKKIKRLPRLVSSRIDAPKTNKWIAALTAAVSMIGSSAYPRLGEYFYVGADPTSASSEQRAVGLVQETFSASGLNLPYQQRVPLDVYGEGQLATVRLIALKKAKFKGAPAFRADFELYTKEGLTRFKALGSNQSQGLGENYLTVCEVVGPNRANLNACSEAATIVLRGFAMRAYPETFTR